MYLKKKIFSILLIFTILLANIFIMENQVFAAQKYSTGISSINDAKYPGYKSVLESLQSKHPNWRFKILYTGLDWNDVISNEYFHTSGDSAPRNLVEAGYSKYDKAWICPVCGTGVTYDSGRWYCASESAIAYMIDPRNSLNDTDIFQFEELTYSNTQTASGVISVSNSTFLKRDSGIVNAILSGASKWNMNAYFIAARIRQEQGAGGATVSGTYKNYEGYYNAFNINASGNGKTTVISNALAYAKSQGWTSISKSIVGGMDFLKNQYINKGQNTLYFQKFDVEEQNGLYYHQYMQNLLAAQNEGNTMRKAYSNAGEESHTFIIPIYENMPASNFTRPVSTSGTSTSTGIGVKYSSHVQDYGWESTWLTDGVTSGTTGKNKKVEAMQIQLVNAPNNVNVKYSSFVEGVGWQGEVKNGTITGTTGQNKKMYAIKLALENTSDYSIKYRVHVQDRGWLSWCENGQVAGDPSSNLKIEAVQIKIVRNTSNYVAEPVAEYISHVQDFGWETVWNENGSTSGTTGKNKKVEAMQIKLSNAPSNSSIKYSTYVEGIGWQSEVKNGAITGTTGQNKKIYGIKIELENLSGYSVQYRVHVQDKGWLDWTGNGKIAGYISKQLKIEAIEIKVVKGTIQAQNNEKEPMGIEYISHVQDYGWETTWLKDGAQSGTTGKNKKVEAMQIKLINAENGANVKYRAYVEGIGWQDAVKDGEVSGTTGKNKRMYAIRISLENADNYSISYRVHLQDKGWLDWVSDGTIAGDVVSEKKIEAIQIKVEEKKKDPIQVEYISHVQDYGWEKTWLKDGAQSGTTGKNKKVEAMEIKLNNAPADLSINYSTNVQGLGWTDAKDGEIGGTVGKNKMIYGIKISLSDTKNYSVKYRVHVQDVGWMDWVSDGQLAGTSAQNKKIEAIEIKVVNK